MDATVRAAPPRSFSLRSLGGAIRLESLVVLILLVVALSIASPYFLSVSNALNILLATSVIGILGFASTFVIAAAGIDLSVGSVLGFAAVVGALAVNALDLPWPAGILLSLAAGMLCGVINGTLIARARIPAFIVTLGMLGVARGAALVLTNGQPVYGLPAPMVWLGQGRPFAIPMPAIIFLAVAAITHFILSRTRFGKYSLVIGDNPNAARATGIHVERHLIALYTLSGALAGLAGLVSAARVNSGDPTAGTGYELTAITAAILGGTNLFGGRASVVGTLIGALIMGVLQNGLNLLAVSSFYQQMAIGGVLVLAVWLDQLNRGSGRA
ncbi:MAG TPA: ABC transporter permease [Acetobacteraceae bacterium]|nr:ABC transporter permease [Acetobacteraceae bacterium]